MFLFNRRGVYIDFHAQDPTLLAVPPDQFMGKSLEEVLPTHVAKINPRLLWKKPFKQARRNYLNMNCRCINHATGKGAWCAAATARLRSSPRHTRRRTSEMELRNSENSSATYPKSPLQLRLILMKSKTRC